MELELELTKWNWPHVWWVTTSLINYTVEYARMLSVGTQKSYTHNLTHITESQYIFLRAIKISVICNVFAFNKITDLINL